VEGSLTLVLELRCAVSALQAQKSIEFGGVRRVRVPE
jgi:hypothetical protein